jgi:glutamyl-tRNA synthetase
MVPEDQLWQKIREWSFNDAFMKKLMPLCHTRIKTFGEFMELCHFFFINNMTYTDTLFTGGSLSKEKAAYILQCILWNLDELENWGRSGIEQASKTVAESFDLNHRKAIIPILYAAITGKHQGPPLYDSFELLGKDRCRARLLNSIDFLGGISNKKMDLLTKAWHKRTCKDLVTTP